jgi:Tol biopolymer transport system component
VKARSWPRRIEDVVIGLVLIGASGLWTLFFGILALLAVGEAGLLAWAVVVVALAVGTYVFFLGIGYLRGAPSSGGVVRYGIGKLGKVSFVVLAVIVALVFIGALIPSEGDDAGIPSDGWLTLSRNGQRVAFASDRASPGDGYAIYGARLGAKPRRVTHSAHNETWPALSPDGSRIVFARSKLGATARQRLFVVNADGSGLRLLTKGDDRDPSWSPDGETIAFTRGEGPVSVFGSVYAVDTDGSNLRVLVRDAQDPAWSPDGSKIAFVRDLEAAVAVFDLKSKSITRVIRSKRVSASQPAWSPDGTRIVFVDMPRDARPDSLYDDADDYLEIYVVNVDGTGLRRLTRNTDIDWSPTWTPDGRIIFERYVGAKPSRFFVMNGDGTGVRRFVIQRENEGH